MSTVQRDQSSSPPTQFQIPELLSWSAALLLALLILAGAFAAVALTVNLPTTPTTTAQQLSAASALALITAAAVAIERVIEAIWTFVGLTFGSWAPLSSVGSMIKDLISKSNATLASYQEKAKRLVDEIDEQVKNAEALLAEAQKQLKDLQGTSDPPSAALTDAQQEVARAWEKLRDLQKVKDNKEEISSALMKLPSVQPQDVRSTQDAMLHATQLSGAIAYLQKALPQFQAHAALAEQSVATLSSFVDSFKDNPARRLISIYIGALFGLVIAGAMQLDVLQAVLEPTKAVTGIGVAFTGILIGLGANPTHQVIRLLEEFKKSQKGKNTTPTQDGE